MKAQDMSLPSFQCLKLTMEDGIAELRFSRPELLNRFDEQAHEDFITALRHLATLDHVMRVLVLSAEGRVFSAGGDFEEMLKANGCETARARMTRDARDVLNAMLDFPVPIISAVQGAAIGLGATIATLSDLVVAWEGAKIADTHVNVGLVAGDGGVFAWSQAIGAARARRYLLTGDVLTGEEAHALGLVTDLAQDVADVLPTARALAERIRALPPKGVNGTRRTFAALTRARMAESFELGMSLEMAAMASADLRTMVEGLRGRS